LLSGPDRHDISRLSLRIDSDSIIGAPDRRFNFSFARIFQREVGCSMGVSDSEWREWRGDRVV